VNGVLQVGHNTCFDTDLGIVACRKNMTQNVGLQPNKFFCKEQLKESKKVLCHWKTFLGDSWTFFLQSQIIYTSQSQKNVRGISKKFEIVK
jgi:hypothetical protein